MLVAYQILTAASDLIRDTFMMVLLIGTGIFLTFRLRGIQARKLMYTLASCSNAKKRVGATYRRFVL